MTTKQTTDAILEEIVINAPAERVFEALTDPHKRTEWWGSEGRFQCTHMESDLRPGGAWMMSGTRMGDETFTLRGVYRAIDRPRLLEFTWNPSWPEPETLVRFELEESAGVTTVRLTHSGFVAGASYQRYQGWPLLLGNLRGLVETAR